MERREEQITTNFLESFDSQNFVLDFIKELKSDKNNLNSFYDLAEIIFLAIDNDDRVVLINKKGADVLGYEKEEIIGKVWTEFISEKFRNKYLNILDQIRTNSYLGMDENINSVITANGEERIIRWDNKILEDKNSNASVLICSGEDITEKNKTEKIDQTIYNILETANSEVNTNDLFRFIHISISKLMKADNFYIALYDNEADIISFPYFIDESDTDAPPKKPGKGLTEYILRTGHSALVNKELDNELIKNGETEMVGTQSAIWLGIPLKILDKTIGVLVVQDYRNESTYGVEEKRILELVSYPISRAIERKIVEDEKSELIEKLKNLNDSKDRLFSLISHDLRTPFHSLLGFSEILNKEYDTLTHEEIREYLRVIYDASKNLFGMTNNLLQYSRFQMGRIDFKPKPLPLKKSVKNMLNLLGGNAVKKQIEIKVEIDKDLSVFADEEMFNSILQNLISNAIKYTHNEGVIKISARTIYFFNSPSDIEIKIEDNGVGMSQKDISNIFNNIMFSRKGTNKEYGTGLGLLLIKEFVEYHKGNIKVESKLNNGTSFIFTLPIVDNFKAS